MIRSLTRTAKRFVDAFHTLEQLPDLLAANHSALLLKMSALSQILSGVEFLITENQALKAALGDAGLSNAQLTAELDAAAKRYADLAADEVAEDELEASILDRLAAVMPAPVAPAEEPAAPEVEEPVAPVEEFVAPEVEEPAAPEPEA